MKPEETLRRTLTPVARVIDAAKGLVEYVASDETVDAYQEVIRAAGWKFTHFRKNAPFLDSHSGYAISDLLGKVVDFRVDKEKKQLVERVQWAIDVPENDMARFGFSMTEKGYLKAVSVGFWPVKFARNGAEGWKEAVKATGMDEEAAASVWRIFLEQEQIELSACVIGANPNALAKAYKDGAASDEDFSRMGFGDAEMGFLFAAAEAEESMTPVDKARMALEMRRIFQGRKTRAPQGDRIPAPGTSGRDGVSGAERRAQFLAELGRL